MEPKTIFLQASMYPWWFKALTVIGFSGFHEAKFVDKRVFTVKGVRFFILYLNHGLLFILFNLFLLSVLVATNNMHHNLINLVTQMQKTRIKIKVFRQNLTTRSKSKFAFSN